MTPDPRSPIPDPELRSAFTLIEVMVAVVIAAFALTLYLKSASGLTRLFDRSERDLTRYAVAALPLTDPAVPVPIPKTRFDTRGVIEGFHIEDDTVLHLLKGLSITYRVIYLGNFGEKRAGNEKNGDEEGESNTSASLSMRLYKESVETPDGAVLWYRLVTPEAP